MEAIKLVASNLKTKWVKWTALAYSSLNSLPFFFYLIGHMRRLAKSVLKCGRYVCNVFGCRLMWGQCKCWAFLIFFSFVCKYLFWTYNCIRGGDFFHFFEQQLTEKVFGIIGWPWKGPRASPCLHWLATEEEEVLAAVVWSVWCCVKTTEMAVLAVG